MNITTAKRALVYVIAIPAAFILGVVLGAVFHPIVGLLAAAGVVFAAYQVVKTDKIQVKEQADQQKQTAANEVAWNKAREERRATIGKIQCKRCGQISDPRIQDDRANGSFVVTCPCCASNDWVKHVPTTSPSAS